MNRRPIGSSVGSSGEGVWALSCSLLENFTPSDEPTPSRLYTIGSSGAEEIFLSSQTHVQLLRRVIKIGRRTIRCLVSPRSSVAPTVRPTLLFFHRRFIRCYTGAWVLPVISVGGLSYRFKPKISRPPRPRCTPPPCSPPAILPRTCTPCANYRPSPPPPPCSLSAAAPRPRTNSTRVRRQITAARRRPQGGCAKSIPLPHPLLLVTFKLW
jgi:hypothetical protein